MEMPENFMFERERKKRSKKVAEPCYSLRKNSWSFKTIITPNERAFGHQRYDFFLVQNKNAFNKTELQDKKKATNTKFTLYLLS